MNALVDPIPTLEKKQKRFGVIPRHCAHDVEASDCVFELFGQRTALRPVLKNSLPHFVPTQQNAGVEDSFGGNRIGGYTSGLRPTLSL